MHYITTELKLRHNVLNELLITSDDFVDVSQTETLNSQHGITTIHHKISGFFTYIFLHVQKEACVAKQLTPWTADLKVFKPCQ